MRVHKGTRFMHVKADNTSPKEGPLPVFSESFLYPRIGKGDARFVLGVADEYEELIKRLGTPEVWRILASPEQVERAKMRTAHALYAARSALNDAAAALCEHCKAGVRMDDYPDQHGGDRNSKYHMVRNPERVEDDMQSWFVYPECKAVVQRKALDEIWLAMAADGVLLGIDIDPAPHPFKAATRPPVSWCSECWLDKREDCHDEERIAAAGDVKI